MATVSAYVGTGGSSGTGSKSTAWTNLTNAVGSGTGTFAVWTSTQRSEVGTWTGGSFGLSVPAGSTINSVTVQIAHKESTTGSTISSVTGQLFIGSTAVGTAQSFTPLTTTERTDSFVVSSGVLDTDIPNLSVQVACTRANSTTSAGESIDWCQITVDYTSPATTATPAVIASTTSIPTPTITTVDPGGWSVVQSASNAAASGTPSVAFATKNLSSGTVLLAYVNIWHGSATAVSDGNGNSFTKLPFSSAGSSTELTVWALATPAGDVGTKPTISVTSSASSYWAILIQEVSGIKTSLDGTAGTAGGGTTASPSYSSTAINEYLVTVEADNQSATSTPTLNNPSGWTLDPANCGGNAFVTVNVAYKKSTGGAESDGWTGPGSDTETAMVAFQLAASTTSAAVTPSAINATTSIPVPAVTGNTSVSVSPSVVAATTTIPAPPLVGAGVPYITGVTSSTSSQAGYFIDNTGTPQLWVCAQPWGLPSNAGKYNGTTGGTWQQDIDNFITTRAGQGVNMILVYPISNLANGGAFDNGNTWDNVPPFNTGQDPSSGLNNTFWTRIDYLLNSALNNGMASFINIDITYNAGTGQCFSGWTTTQWQQFGTALGTRYKNQPGFSWNFGDDTYPTTYDSFYDAFLTGLSSAGDSHPISAQWEGEYTSRYETDNNLKSTWGTTHSTYNYVYTYNCSYWCVEYAYGEVANQAATTLLPVVWGNGYYYAGGSTYSSTADRAWRQEIWWSLSSGARGIVTESNQRLWSSSAPGSAATQWSFVNSLKKIITTHNSWVGWNRLLPDLSSSFVTSGRGTRASGLVSGGSATPYEPAFTNSYVTASITPEGDLAVCYLPNHTTITVNTALLRSGWTASWIDPINGTATDAGTSGTYNSTTKGTNSQGDPDWALVFQAPTSTPANVTPAVVAATSSIPAPTVTAVSNASVAPTVIGATSNILSPVLHTGSTLAPATISGEATIPLTTESTGSTLAPPVVTARGSISTPAIVTGDVIAPSPIAATTAIPGVTIEADSSASAAPSVIAATAAIPLPVVYPPPNLVTVVQTKDSAGLGSPNTLNFDSAVAVGNSVIVWICEYNTSGLTISSAAPTYNGAPVPGATMILESQATDVTASRDIYFAIWLLPDVQSSGTSVTTSVTNGAGDANAHYYIAEVKNLGAAPALDTGSPNPALNNGLSGTAISSGVTGNAASASGIVLGGMMQTSDNGGWTSPAGWTTLTEAYGGASYQVYSAPGASYTWDTAVSSSTRWATGAVILAASAPTITTSVIAAKATIPVVTVTVTSSANVSPTVIAATAAIPAPAVVTSGNANIAPSSLAATATIQAPVVNTTGNANITPVAVTATSALATPTVSTTGPAVATTSIANAAQNVEVKRWLIASGGTAPYTWAISSGNLPAGLTLDSDGTLHGTPTATGTSTFTVEVTDSSSQTATASLSIDSVSAPFSPSGSTTDSNGVITWNISSGLNLTDSESIRVLEPTSPNPDYDHGFLITLPVEAGTDSTTYGNGLDTARTAGLHNAYNLTVIEPSTGGFWLADNPSNGIVLQETYMLQLVAWVKANYATTGTEKTYLIGFSRTGLGNQGLFFHRLDLYDGVATWDSPVGMTGIDGTDPDRPGNPVGGSPSSSYGTQDNFDANYLLSSANLTKWMAGSNLTAVNRIWLGGYVAFQGDMVAYDTTLTNLGVKHTFDPSFTADTHAWHADWMSAAMAALVPENNANITPAVVSATASILAPSVSTASGAAVTPAVINATTNIYSISFSSSVAVTTSVVPGRVTIPTPNLLINTNVLAGAVAARATLPTPAVQTQGNVAVLPSVIAAQATIQPLTADTGTAINPTTVSATSSVPGASIGTGTAAGPGAVAATTQIPTPSVLTSNSTSVHPNLLTGSATIPGPSITAGSSTTVAPNAVNGVASIPSVGAQAGTTVTASPVTATTEVLPPSVVGGSSSTVSPGVLRVFSFVLGPTVTISSDATVTPGTIAARATVQSASASVSSTANPAVIQGSTSLGVPQFLGSVDVQPSAVMASASILAPSVVAIRQANITPSVVTASTAIPSPSTGVSAAVQPSAISAQVHIPVPVDSTGASVLSPVIRATADIPLPTMFNTFGISAVRTHLGGSTAVTGRKAGNIETTGQIAVNVEASGRES